MNLKEAFRCQNKLQALMNEAQSILGFDANIIRIQTTVLRKKVMAEAENETTVAVPSTEYSEQITQLAGFLLYLLELREKLAHSIRRAKDQLPLDMDSEVSLNAKRQSIAETFRQMAALRSSEVLVPNGGLGYRFNTDGHQVSYKCDLERVVTIHFDRNVIRGYLSRMNRKADEVSAQLDRCQVNAAVDFALPFDVNDSFGDVFSAYLEGQE